MNKITPIDELQQTLEEIFIKNITFFKKEHPHIYKKIVDFENLKIENYSIDFINNQFQLISKDNQTKFYEVEPFLDSINRVNNFDITHAFSLIKLDKLPRRNHFENEINSYLYINSFIENFQNVNIEVNKFIFIGTLLGVHINDFHKSLNAKVYLIIEPNIEIFRLSMFLCDYSSLFNSKLFFAVGENENSLKNIVNEFLDFKYEYNNLIFYELAHKINEDLISKLSLWFTLGGQMRYPFSDYLISFSRCAKYILEDKNSLLNLSKIYNFLSNKNVLFLGAGPSLGKNLDFIATNRDKFIIVAVSATLKILEKIDIIPDIIMIADGQKFVIKQFEVDEKFYKNSTILVSQKLDFDLYNLLKNGKLFFYQDSLNLFKNFGFITGVTVGDMGVDILLRLGVKNLYLLGIDAALDSKTGATHSSEHIFSKNIDLQNTDSSKIDFKKTVIYVKGNFEKEVPTTLEYKEMIEEIDEKFTLLNSSFKIYNLSNGAYFTNTIPTKTHMISTLESINKDSFKEEFLKDLQNISNRNIEIYAKEFKKEQKIFEKLSLESLENMNFIKEFQKIKQKFPNSIVVNILDRFLRLVLPYHSFLKDKKIADEILKNQLKEIFDKFKMVFSTLKS